jgi:hypothetical protein
MTDVALALGDFNFARFEVPESIAFGGEQKLNVHELVGGKRIIDAMGETPRALEWSGWFVGPNGLGRARYIDGLRKAGKAIKLTWSELAFTVVIHSFECTFQRFYRLPYRITCEVVSDDTAVIKQAPAPTPGQLINDDLASANGLAGNINNGVLTGLMGTLSTAIGTVSNFATAAQATVNSVLLPIQAVRGQVSILLQAAENTALNVTSLGGVLPVNLIQSQVFNLASQVAAVQTAGPLVNLDRVMGRMASNVASINTGTRIVTVSGTDLYSVAVDQYSDAMGWAALAQANSLTDPSITGVTTLIVPPLVNNNGGILNV